MLKISDNIAKEDIIDNEGRLLLRKGQILTDGIIQRLKRYGKFNPEEFADSDNKQSDTQTITPEEFITRKNIRNPLLLAKPTNILNNIIFESKAKSWWIHVQALFNYVDWLYTHSIDVAMISMMMAVELGYSDNGTYELGLGALLHDVGMLLVPKSILSKPGELTEAEWSIIKQHCYLGVSSLQGYNLSQNYMDIIIQHHERLDGSGYPKGLREPEICRNAKIVMVANDFDAMTSYRPYMKLLKVEDAKKILSDKEKKYPQDLVSLLFKILE